MEEYRRINFRSRLTLLQKYEHYKSQNLEIIEDDESNDSQKECFDLRLPQEIVGEIDDIHQKVENKALENRRKGAIITNLPPHIYMHFRYRKPGEESLISNVKNVTLYDKNSDANAIDNLFTFDEESDKDQPRLEIIIEDAYNLDKWLKPKESIYSAAVKCVIISDFNKHRHKMKTKYKRASFDYARWDHMFILQGFTLDYLKQSTLEFSLKAKTNYGKREIGTMALCSDVCTIGHLTEEEEKIHVCTSDTKFWGKYLDDATKPKNIVIPVVKGRGHHLKGIRKML